jgi:aspartyl-tRNA(Asn)/glutamyl-tRNA(Gln) amidotransferase subunit A
MTDQPWTDDASSLVDAFRAGERSPVEELEATLAAIARSELNCFSFLDPERAMTAAGEADVSRPFGGVPIGVKELDSFAGWPETEASLVFEDRIATTTTIPVAKLLEQGGAVPVGLTTASEFGGLNVSMTKLNGVTHNPWRWGRTVGGSSSGSAAAVAGGLVSLATGGDGGGSIRIPSGYTGLLGMKGTYGRVARGPTVYFRPGTVVLGCLARSVRDAARHYDVCAGTDHRDPWSLPSSGTWERDLGSHDLTGRKVAVIPDLGGVELEGGVEDRLRSAAAELIAATGMQQVDITVQPPNLAAQWMIGNLSTLLAELGDRWPACADDLTEEVAIGLRLSEALYNLRTAAAGEVLRVEANEAMAAAFDQADFIISTTNPGPAFPADAAMSSPTGGFIEWATSSTAAKVGFRAGMGAVRTVSGAFPKLPNRVLDEVVARFPDLVAMGALTIISNIYGNPAVSIPAGQVDELPIGMQVLAPHHHDALLFDVALAAERTMPWPRVAPAVTLAPTPT